MLRIAFIDDNLVIRDSYESLLRIADFNPTSFVSAEQFLAEGDVSATDCLIVDFELGGMTGAELVQQLRNEGHQLPAIILSGFVHEALEDACNIPGVKLLQKPCPLEELFSAIRDSCAGSSELDP